MFKLLGLICSQYETILSVHEMRSDGMDLAQMKAALGIHEFRIKKGLRRRPDMTGKAFRKVLMKAYEADRNIKTGADGAGNSSGTLCSRGLGTLRHRAEWSEIGEGAAGCGQKLEKTERFHRRKLFSDRSERGPFRAGRKSRRFCQDAEKGTEDDNRK